MTIDDKTYRDLVQLARTRCREAAMSVVQLLDDQDQVIALLISTAAELAFGAMVQMGDVDDDLTAYYAVTGITHALGREKILAGKAKHEAANMSPKSNNSPQPDGASPAKSNRKNG